MKIEKVNMGEIILRKVEEKGLSHKRFAEMLGKKRQNINSAVFNRTSIDTNLLCDISEVLDCNFFNYYKSNEINDTLKVSAKFTIEIEGESQSRDIKLEFKKP